ncbi:hypothetical protein Tco_1262057 [Tanacetum coccineum]
MTGKLWFQDGFRGKIQYDNQGRPFQRNNARGNGVAGNVGGQNRGGIINPGQAKPIKKWCQYWMKNSRCILAENRFTNIDDDMADHQNDMAPQLNDSTEASGSKPRSNTKKNRILPAKKENKKEVEVHLRTNNHEMCVVNILNSVNATSTVKIVLNKGKQIWKPKGRLSDNSLYKTKRVWKATGKLFTDIGLNGDPQERNSP